MKRRGGAVSTIESRPRRRTRGDATRGKGKPSNLAHAHARTHGREEVGFAYAVVASWRGNVRETGVAAAGN